jgi:hypothetical protein
MVESGTPDDRPENSAALPVTARMTNELGLSRYADSSYVKVLSKVIRERAALSGCVAAEDGDRSSPFLGPCVARTARTRFFDAGRGFRRLLRTRISLRSGRS